MKELGKVLLKAANDYPIGTLGVTVVVAVDVIYNVCTLIDKCAYYRTVKAIAETGSNVDWNNKSEYL